MKNIKLFLLLLLVHTISVGGLANASLATELESRIKTHLPTASVGIVVLDANNAKKLYQYRSNHYFIPASNVKLLTAAAALQALGQNYRYETKLGELNSQNKQDVILQFSGDPTITIDDLYALLAKATFKHTINDVIVDDSRYQSPDHPIGTAVEDTIWYYAAPVSALILNENKFHISLKPTHSLGDKISINTNDPFIHIQSNLVSATEKQANEECSIQEDLKNNTTLELSGCWPLRKKPSELDLAIPDVRQYLSVVIKNYFKKKDIRIAGKISFKKSPKNVNWIAKHDSPPVKSLVATMLKDSNNIVALSLTKELGKYLYNEGSFQQGSRAIKETLQHASNLNFSKLRIDDGAGFGYTLLTPQQIASLLYVAANSEYSHAYLSALPSAAFDGTLKNRMRSFDLKGRVKAKTGSRKFSSCISGYILDKESHRPKIIFSIMINQFLDKSIDVKHVEDQLIADILHYTS